METKFECTYPLTAEVDDETLRYVLFRRWNAVFSYVCGALFFVLAVAMGVWFYQSAGYVPAKVILLLVLAPLLPLTQVLMYGTARKNRHKQMEEITGGKPVTVTVRVSDAGIEYLSSARTDATTLPFDEIKRTVETKNLLGLMSKSKVMYPMAKSGFTKGTPEELKQFLKEKGIR